MSGYQEPTAEELENRLAQAEAFDNAVERAVTETVTRIDHETGKVTHERINSVDEVERTAAQSGSLYIGGPDETTQDEIEPKVIEALTAVLINLQRDFDTFKSTVGSAFKEIGHADTWRKIAGE
jgi:hypothetical protein